MSQKVLNKRSSVVTNGNPKLPTSEQIEYGEIAINFAEGYETLSIKNNEDDIVTFSSDNYWGNVLEENEYVTSMALNDINSKLVSSASQIVNDVGFITGYTETDPTVPSWAKQSTKPSYTASEVGALPTGTTLDGIPDGTTRKLSDYATSANTHNAIINVSGDIKSYIDNKVSTVYKYKGTLSVLPSDTSNVSIGDVYNIDESVSGYPAGTNFAWTGIGWDGLGGLVDLSTLTPKSNFEKHIEDTLVHVSTNLINNSTSGAMAYTDMITGVTAAGRSLTKKNKVVEIPSASSSTFGVIKVGNFISNSNGTISVTTGTTNTTVAAGNHMHTEYASTETVNGLNSTVTAHTENTEIHVTAAQKSSWDSKVSNVQSDWNATTGLAAILNKPSIPTVNDNTITLTFNGATVGTFTLNQNSNKTIDIGTIIGLPSFSSANNGQILGVVNGQLAWVTPITIYTGSDTPSASQGNDGDIYLQTS